MTIVAALKSENGQVWIGSDSRLTGGTGRKHSNNGPKWIVYDHFLIAVAGSWRAYNILTELLYDEDFRKTKMDSEADFITVLHFLRAYFKESDALAAGPEGSVENNFLLCSPTKIYKISEDLSYLEKESEAIGSGAAYALGALYVLPEDSTIEHKVAVMLDTAEALDSHCGGSMYIRLVSSILNENAPKETKPKKRRK